MKRIAHWFAHLLGLNCGRVISWTRKDGTVMIGFRCECGNVSGIHPSLAKESQS